jgi:hypothetical protein
MAEPDFSKLGFSVLFKRDEYTGKVVSCILECRGIAMTGDDGISRFLALTPPAATLRDLEFAIDRLMDQLSAVRKEARTEFKLTQLPKAR